VSFHARVSLFALLVLGCPASLAAAELIPLPKQSTWRYNTTGTDLGSAWRAPAYADNAWPSGPGVLGFGDPFITTAVPMGPNASTRYPTTYFRTTINVADDPSTITSLVLSANYDDGFVLWVNGFELARRGVAANPAYGALAANHEGGAYASIDVTALKGLLVTGANTLAAEVHQTALTSSDLAWDAELKHSTSAAFVTRGPYLMMGTPDAITVRWRTNVASDSRLWVGPAPGQLTLAASDGALTTEHELRATGLPHASHLTYAVGTSSEVLSGDDAQTWFETAPAPDSARSTRIWVLGDSGLPSLAQEHVRDAYQTFTGGTPTDVWLMLGDNAYTAGTDADYTNGVFDPYAEFMRTHVLWPTRGNHDVLYGGANNDYYDVFTMPTAGEAGGTPSLTEAWYSFDRGNVHFVCLDSEGSDLSPGSAMLTWLATDLAATDRSWIIAFWHHPPYTKGSHDSDDPADSGGRMWNMRQNAMPVLEAGGVDLVLNGHSHSYERSFLLDGHYGLSSTLTPAMLLDSGDGRRGGDGAYAKATPAQAPHQGEVVAVAGSSAQTSGGTLDHPAMSYSLNSLGSMVIDVRGLELDAIFLDDAGAVRDSFAITKGAGVVGVPPPQTHLALSLLGANPSRAGTSFALELPHAGKARLSVVDAAGRLVRRLPLDDTLVQRVPWDGRDEARRATPAGVYFGLLEYEGARRVTRLVRLP
jgi:hypothetical protein